MDEKRRRWLVWPFLGLCFGTGCSGPAPEPPAARAPAVPPRPVAMPAAEQAPSNVAVYDGPCVTDKGDTAALRAKSTAAPSGQPAAPGAIADRAEGLPRMRLKHVRPTPLYDGSDARLPARPASFDEPTESGSNVPPWRQSAAGQPKDLSDSAATGRASHLADSLPTEAPPQRAAERSGMAPRAVNTGAAAERAAQLDAVSRQAAALNRHAFELAQRSAIFSARQEFVKSLESIAAALDADRGNHAHQRMLAAGFKALDEADDFAARDIGGGAEPNVAEIIRGHETPVLKRDTIAEISCQAAMGRYLTYVQEQLAGAVENAPQGSAALFGLGKIYSVAPEAHGPKDATNGAKRVVFYQSALMVDRRNFLAANELGVALVRFGRLPEAKAAFLHSLSISSQPLVWQNLAAVHENLGERDLAQRARQAAAIAANQNGRGDAALTPYDVQWVDPATFARSKPIDADPVKGAPAAQPPAEHKSIADYLPWSAPKRQ